MSSIFSGYASFFTEQVAGRFLTSSAKQLNDNVVKTSSDQIVPMISDQTFDLLKKFITYTTISTLVASSAFYIGFNYAKQRNRFDPRSREDDKTDQVIDIKRGVCLLHTIKPLAHTIVFSLKQLLAFAHDFFIFFMDIKNFLLHTLIVSIILVLVHTNCFIILNLI